MNQTWADGFGNWHAIVADSPKAKRTAKAMIKAELNARGESPNYALEIDRIPMPKGVVGYVQYVER